MFMRLKEVGENGPELNFRGRKNNLKRMIWPFCFTLTDFIGLSQANILHGAVFGRVVNDFTVKGDVNH